MSEVADKPLRSRLTGCWAKEGINGKFFTGQVVKAELLAALEKHGDLISVYVNPIEVKTNENSPDISITFTDKVPYVKK